MVRPLLRRTIVSCMIALAAALSACGGQSPAPTGPQVELAIAPLGLVGVGDAIWDIRVRNGQSDVVWERRMTSARFGDGGGALTYVGPCDASQPAHTVELWLVGAYAAPVPAGSVGAFASGSAANVTATPPATAIDLVNPTLTGPLTQPATCSANADARVAFDVTVMRRAEQGFFDIAVAFEDIFCSAKFDCCYDDNGDGCAPDGSEDIELLFDATGQRARTFVLGFACAAPVSAGEQAELYLDALQLDCDVNSDGTTFLADLTLDPTQKGNLCVAGEVDTCLLVTAASGVDANDYLYQAATYQTFEVTAGAQAYETVSWNIALGVNPAIASCRLRTRGTYDDAADPDDHAHGGRVKPGAIYPYIQWDVDLDTCGSEPLTFAASGPVTTRYTDPAAPLAFGYHFGEGISAGPFCEPACMNGGACESGVCDCTNTGYTGATCDEPICGPGLVYEDGQCVNPDVTPPAAPVITSHTFPLTSNDTALTLQGTCETGATVSLSGALVDTTPCVAGEFSFDLSPVADGTYEFALVQTDPAGNDSTATGFTWTRDTAAPAAIVLTAPSPNPFGSGADAVTIAGSCESGATLLVTGDETLELLCENGTFSLDIPRTSNGTFDFAIAQRDDADNTSGAVNVQWTRDDVTPSAVTLISPTPNPVTTNGDGITIAGTCAGANTVELSGPTNASVTCNTTSFAFNVSSLVDGTFVYTVRQVGAVNDFPSDPVTVTWTRDTLVPGTPTITQPSTNPYASGDTELVLSGTCESGTTVHLTGDTTGTTTCGDDGTYAFSISSSVDGTFEYAIHQQDAASNTSGAIAFQWLRDTNIPASPTIDDPGTSPFYSATTPLELSGSCTTGYLVFLQGSSTQSETCVGGTYAFSDPKSTDGTYAYSVYQQNPNNLSESTVQTLVWHLDRVAPDEVTVTSPAANPYFSGDDTITIAGACEPGSTVNVNGSETLTLPCPSGSYTFQVTRLSNATYNFNIVQTDKAGNTSLNYLFQWVRDATIPATPVIVSPASSPFYSSASSLVISGTCQTGYRVDLTGSSTQNMTCASSAFSFTVPGSTDATRTYAVKQTNTLTSLASSETSLTWVRDATAPALVTITQPSTNPYTSGDTLFALNGTCETNATVSLSGAQANSQVCTNGTFTFNLSKSIDGTYNYTLVQTDRANNSSGSRSFQWVRNTAIPPTPVLSSPSPNPLVSNTNSITVAGSCAGTNTVNISGSHVASTTCSGGAFSFTVTKTSDATYNFSVTQTSSANGSVSSAATAQWTRDTVAPSAPVLTSITPQSPSSATNPKVIGTASGATTVQLYKTNDCSGAIAATGPVATFTSTGIAFTATQQATNLLSAKSLDAANNASVCSNSLSHVHRSAQLVKDLNIAGSGDSNPVNFGVVGSKVYFRATNGIVGNELWVTDGTLAGTTMVKDINVADSSNPYAFLDLDGTVALFAADDGENGMELWRTDGTESGTWMLKDINEGGGHSSPNNFLKASASVIYFTANHDDFGVELWKTDGTANGTVMVADLEPGAGGSSPGNLRVVGDAPGIVFTATTTAHGVELWKSNGTTAGTTCFDINAGTLNASPSYLTNFNGYVYLQATEADTDRNVGAELYRTNGTTVELVQDIRVGTSSGAPSYLAVAGTTLFMYARDLSTGYELYKIGTTGSVTLVRDIVAGGTSSSPVYITAISSTKVVFRANDGTTGDEPWVSDGTSAGTFRLADINAGTTNSGMGVPVAVNGKAYFVATNDGEAELYETDGTSAGTLKRDVNPGAQGSGPTALTAYGTKLIFSGYTNAEGREPRIVSGGTLSMLRDLNPQTSSLPGSFVQLGTSNTMIFAAQDPTYGRELWKTDGTLAGTVLIKDINTTEPGASSNPTYLVAVGPSHVFFRADDGVNGVELWRTDGTAAGTVLVTDIFPGIDPSTPNFMTALDNNTVLFAAMDSVANGIELWKATTTSSPANPATLVKNIHTTANTSSSPQSMVLMGGKIYMRATDTTLGHELFVSDGTTAGTVMVKDVRSDGSSAPANLTVLGTKVFFTATETATGNELYVTDGTAAGTVRLSDIAPGVLSSSPGNIRVLGSNVVFAATNSTVGRELYLSSGSGAPTLLKDIRVGAGNSNPSAAVVVGSKGVFQAGDDAGGIEVWMTDGTPAGTVRLADVRPGTANSNSGAFVAIDTSNLWFIGNEGVNGSEPWRSNLTAAGTYLIQDINTLGPSWGGSALMVNGTVYFTATDGINGVELWKY